jgi:hypothetical protein
VYGSSSTDSYPEQHRCQNTAAMTRSTELAAAIISSTIRVTNVLLTLHRHNCCCSTAHSQYIFEEKVMAVDDAPPLVVIGMEGLWGSVIMLMLAAPLYYLPGRDKGSIEDSFDTLVMIQNSSAIRVMLGAFFVTITTYNIFCIYVTAYLSAIWHAILDNFRPVSGELLLHCAFCDSVPHLVSGTVSDSEVLQFTEACSDLLKCLLLYRLRKAALKYSCSTLQQSAQQLI